MTEDDDVAVGAKLEQLGELIRSMGTALLEDDDIMGVLASSGVADVMPRLPENIRHTFRDSLSDESALAARADDRYEDERHRMQENVQ